MSQDDDQSPPLADGPEQRPFPRAEIGIRKVRSARTFEELATITADAMHEGLERQRELLIELFRAGEIRDAHAEQLRAIAAAVKRVEDRLGWADERMDLTTALVQGVAAAVGVTKEQVETLREAERARRARDTAADGIAAHTRTRLDSLAEEVARVAQAKLEPLERKVDELTDTQQRRMVAEAEAAQVLMRDLTKDVARARLNSSADLEREARAAEREEHTHERDEQSKLRWWVLGIVAAVIAASAAGVVGRMTGHAIPVEPPAGEHHHRE